jgi:predicted RNase H-like HicB family nuclease
MANSFKGTFLKRNRWWIGWADEVPGALTQGRIFAEAKSNLRDAIRLMLKPVDLDKLPKATVVNDRVCT